jgi:hypothetical protein
MSMDKDNRKRERLPMNQDIELSTSTGQTVKTQGINISESGMLCRADSEVPAGTLVKFKLTIPGSKSDMCLDCEGIVIKCSSNNGKYDVVVDLTD